MKALADGRDRMSMWWRSRPTLGGRRHRELESLRKSMAVTAREEAVAAGSSAERTSIEVARAYAKCTAAAAQHAAVAIAREHAEAASVAAQQTAIAAAREHVEAASGAVEQTCVTAAREHTEAAVVVLQTSIASEIAVLRRELARVTARLDATDGLIGSAEGNRATPSSPIAPGLYLALEDQFRGDVETILERQAPYVDFVLPAADPQHPVLDLGCGRGEWLRALASRGVPARGVDSNPASVAECRVAGLDVEQGDLLDALRTARDGAFGAITLFQVVEHLPFNVLTGLITECARALRAGGVLIMETPNALNIRVAASNFWLDPTHERPLHPELLRFLVARAGFAQMEDVFSSELGPLPTFDDLPSESGRWLRELATTMDGPADYALVARTSPERVD